MKPHFEDHDKWNVIFLIYAEISDNSTAGTDSADVGAQIAALESLLGQMALYPRLRVFYIKNTVLVKNSTVYSDKTVISELRKNKTAEGNTLKGLQYTSVEDFVQKEASVEQAFKFVESITGPRRTLLITWDHGSAFGIFKKTVQDPHPDNSENSLEENYTILDRQPWNSEKDLLIIRNKPVRANFFSQQMDIAGAPAREEDSPSFLDILSNDRLANAITSGFSAKRVEALLMYNCDMQNIHTAYSLKDCVGYLIAPETTIAAPGYDYASVIDFIGRNSTLEITGAMIGIQAVQTLLPYYRRIADPDTLNRYAIFAVALENYEEVIINSMRAVVKDMMKRMKDSVFAENVGVVREKCYDFGDGLNYYLVDFIYFMKKLAQVEPEMAVWYSYLKTALDSVIVTRLVGNDLYPSGGTTQKAENAPLAGMTIYFPDTAMSKSDTVVREFILPNSPFSSKVIGAIDWRRFLNKLNGEITS